MLDKNFIESRKTAMNPEENKPTDFIREAINEDLKNGRFTQVHTRFPPDPNG